MKIWFSSDYHFNHDKIRAYENRPFSSVDEMNNEIIRRHNERVKKEDLVYFLGDLGFYASKQKEFRGEGMNRNVIELLEQMNGNFVRLAGNHCKRSNKTHIPTHRIVLSHGGIFINLVHRPQDTVIEDEQHYYPLTIHGHVHGAYKTKEIENNKIVLLINVSVETHNYYPYSFDEIMEIYFRWLNNHPRKKEIWNWIKERDLNVKTKTS